MFYTRNFSYIIDLVSYYYQQPKVSEETKSGLESLPSELIIKILSSLNDRPTLERCLLVNKRWRVWASDESLWENTLLLRRSAFGKNHWQKYFGDVGEEPPLPKNILEILNGPCPFFPEKKVKETHILVLIPETVEGRPLNLSLLKKLVKTPRESTKYQFILGMPVKEWHATKCYILKEIINHEDINKATTQSHWALLTADILSGMLFGEKHHYFEEYSSQKHLIATAVQQTGLPYEVPNVLDAAICILMHDVRSGKCLFPPVYRSTSIPSLTRCAEGIDGRQICVGFDLNKFHIGKVQNFALDAMGIAALRKLY